MSDYFLGEIRLFGFDYAPEGWAKCQGQLMPIESNEALFTLLGTQYGGNGSKNFALPNLQSRLPICMGQGPGLSNYVIGQTGGEQQVTLSTTQLPRHTHPLVAQNGPPNQPGASGNSLGSNPRTGSALYTNTAGSPVPLAGTSIQETGGSQPFPILPPYLALNYCIALQGIYPARS